MPRTYHPIRSQPMARGAIVRQATYEAMTPALLHDPAVAVMTDLSQVPAVAVDPDAGIDTAMRIMVRRGVRSLFVLNVESEVLGLITATDLLGEKPLLYIQAHGGRRSDLRVRDLMTPHAQLEVLAMADVAHARVGNVLATLRAKRRQHAMAVEIDGESGREVVRGVFSASRLESQLGMPVTPSEEVQTFAEIKAALTRA